MEDNKNLLDLCRLNLMEEHIEDESAPEPERSDILKLIDYKKRNLMLKIGHEQKALSEKTEE